MLNESLDDWAAAAYNSSPASANESRPYNSSRMDEAPCNLTYESTGEFQFSALFNSMVSIMYAVVLILSLTGNGMVCYIVQTSPRMKTVTNYFIMNLAVGDIMLTLFCIPFTFVSMLLLRYWPFGAVMCKVVYYLQAVSVLVSAYTLLAISIDRYMVIMHPLKPRLGKTAAKSVVAAVWLGAIATAAPTAIVSQLRKPSAWHHNCNVDVCLEVWEQPSQGSQYTYALLTLQFALPLASLVCTYARIAYVVWGGRPPGEAHGARDSRMQRSKRKMVKMMIAVVAVFTVCWLPLNVFIVICMLHADEEAWIQWWAIPYWWLGCHWLAMSHSCYNPFIYCYMNMRYRRGFQQVLSYILKSELQLHNRSSGMEGIPMTEMIGPNGIDRRGTSTSSNSRLNRMPTSSSCTSDRRPRGRARGSLVPTPPRALSTRTQFN